MTWARARAGLFGGLASLVPLVAIILLTALEVVRGDAATPLALGAFGLSLLLGGGVAGYLAGQARRRRREAKAFVGGMAGIIAALTYCAVLFGVFFYRFLVTPIKLRNTALDLHPLRVMCAIIFFGALQVVIAMIVTQLTARPLPPPRPSRRLTSQMRAMPLPSLPQQQPPQQTPPRPYR